ncbi:MAG: biotin--[acetyl-CoA-carboxylase] ligase [Blautia sp.]
MSAKKQVFEYLVENKGDYVSGSQIAGELGVSRNTIWKAVKALQEEGYAIDAVSNRGYSLKEDNLRLSKEEIQRYLGITSCRMEVYETVDSTNTMMKKRAQNGEQEGLVLIAQEQTKGRGRSGRSFYSPKDCGIYMSILLRPSLEFSKAAYLTTCAAASVAETMDAFMDEKTQIKWVNDIYFRGKKAAGILTEAAVDMEDGKLDYAIVGIGMNIFSPKEGYPIEIRETSAAFFETSKGREGIRNEIIARILERFFAYYQELPMRNYYQSYRAKSFLLGREVLVQRGDQTWTGKAVDLDEDFHLLVERKDGTSEVLNSGEVHVR